MTRSGNAHPRSGFPVALGVVLIALGVLVNEFTVPALLGGSAGRVNNPVFRAVIATLELALVVTGVYLVRARPGLRPRDLLVATVPLALCLLLIEGVLRLSLRTAPTQTLTFSETAGWVPEANVRKTYVMPGYGQIHYTTTRDGFRRFGDVTTRKIKIFVIGDSFTQAYTVSDGQAYYDYIAAHAPDVEVFAYGANGYGSLQEYFALDRYIDVVQPDLVLWQLCSNDIVNNDYELETASLENNNERWRPYLEHGRIVMRYPERYQIIGHSYLLRFIAQRIRLVRVSRFGERSIEWTDSRDHPLFRKAIATTADILGLVRRRAGSVPVVAFSADRPGWLGDTYERITRDAGIDFITGVPDTIDSARASGVRVDARQVGDAHWSAAGHAIAGRVIERYLMAHGLIPLDSAPRPAVRPRSVGRVVGVPAAATPSGRALPASARAEH